MCLEWSESGSMGGNETQEAVGDQIMQCFLGLMKEFGLCSNCHGNVLAGFE